MRWNRADITIADAVNRVLHLPTVAENLLVTIGTAPSPHGGA